MYIAGDLCATGNLDILCKKEYLNKESRIIMLLKESFNGLVINKLNENDDVIWSVL